MVIDLQNAKCLQELKGWGTSACWWSQACPKGDVANEISKLLYGDDGLKLNIYRYNIGGGVNGDISRISNPWRRTESFMNYDIESEEASWDFSKDENAVNMMKISLELGNIDTLILFANSPHWSQCSTGTSSGSMLYHTCNIPKMNYQKFVDYILDVTQHFLDEGYPVNYISPINEPQWKWGGPYVWQEGCHYEVDELVEIYHLFAISIQKRNMPVKLYGPETGEMLGLTQSYIDAISADKEIMKVMDTFAFHSYHSDDSPETRYEFKSKSVSNHPEFKFDMSEWCELPNKSHTKDFKGALITARIIGQDLIYAGAQSWTSWVAVNGTAINDDGCDYSDAAISANEDFSHWYIAKRYYGIAHFSKYIPVGSRCLDFGFRPTKDNNSFNVFAYLTPNNETVLVVVNEENEQELEIKGNYSKMRIISSVCDNELQKIYDGKFNSVIKSKQNSIMTIILK